MFDRKYTIFLDNIFFDSLYDANYYHDKSNFFAHGAKQFFTIYQISRNGDFNFTILEEISGERFEFQKAGDFKRWVKQNYAYFADYLDQIYEGVHPDSKLK